MNTTVIPCPTCSGVGISSSSAGKILCPTCHGGGYFLLQNTIQLTAAQPLVLPTPTSELIRKAVPIVTVVAGLFLVGTAIVSRQSIEPAALIWQKGWPGFALGLGGLLAAYGLAKSEHHSDESLLLSALRADSDLVSSASIALSQLPRSLETAARLHHRSNIDEALLLLVLFEQPRIRGMVNRLELQAAPLVESLQAYLATDPQDVGQPSMDSSVRFRLIDSYRATLEQGYNSADLEDVLLSFLQSPGRWADFFHSSGLELAKWLTVSRWYAADSERQRQWKFWVEAGKGRPSGYMNRAWTALPTHILDQYSTDLTQLAAKGRVTSAAVRQHEIDRMLEILGRRSKNSLVLVGEAGVGKTTLLGGLALRMIEGNVPEILQDKRLVLLELSTLLAQAGNAEQNLEQVIEEVGSAGNVILAIPDIHLLAGTSGAALDAAALVGSALRRGSVQLISTARHADYHRYIENSPLLSQVLETIEIAEASVEQTIMILEEEVPQIEGRQHVLITYPAIENAATYAKRYLTEQTMPQSAITLLDEAASTANIAKKRVVRGTDLAEAIEKRTGIPVGEANSVQADKLLNLEQELHQRVIGQQAAISAVADAMRRAAAGLNPTSRPLASFLFVGPTGTGKTELAKALAALHFGRQDALLRFDMSEYQDGTSSYRLIGAPAGSSNEYTEGGTLTQAIREQPYSLVLLDEIEKAHPDVLNLFLQLLDDGRLTENTGRTVSFTNCVVIATSNAGTQELTELLSQGADSDSITRQTLSLLSRYFKPELVNRFDRIVPFTPLSQAEVSQIASLQLVSIANNMQSQGYTVTFSDDLPNLLAVQGFDPAFGARPLRRVVQDKVEGVLARAVLERTLTKGTVFEVTSAMIQ